MNTREAIVVDSKVVVEKIGIEGKAKVVVSCRASWFLRSLVVELS